MDSVLGSRPSITEMEKQNEPDKEQSNCVHLDSLLFCWPFMEKQGSNFQLVLLQRKNFLQICNDSGDLNAWLLKYKFIQTLDNLSTFIKWLDRPFCIKLQISPKLRWHEIARLSEN